MYVSLTKVDVMNLTDMVVEQLEQWEEDGIRGSENADSLVRSIVEYIENEVDV